MTLDHALAHTPAEETEAATSHPDVPAAETPEPDSLPPAAGLPADPTPSDDPVGERRRVVGQAAAQLVAAEERLAEHTDALRSWAAFLGDIQSELTAAEARERTVQQNLAALQARLEGVERALSSIHEVVSAEVTLAREARATVDARLAALERRRLEDAGSMRTLAAALAGWSRSIDPSLGDRPATAAPER
jgi:septal ring factor EnvC (AmiA/AmiB activator)